MQSTEAETLKPDSSPARWMTLALLAFGVVYFANGLVFERMYAGDGADNLLMFSYQYSGLLRGEYPLWNPLNRTGEPLYLMQALFMANPISNITIIASILFGVTNIFLSYLIFNYILIALYVLGIYQVVFVITKNHLSSTFGGILGLGSGLISMSMYTNSDILLMHSVPWICYGFIRYFQSFYFKYLAIFILAVVTSIYSYEVVYTLCFLFLVFLSAFVFYRDFFSFDNFGRIPRGHLYVLICALLICSIPMALIVLKAFGGDYLPPGSRFDVTQMVIQKDLSLDTKVGFEMMNKFFFTCENCLTTMFTGAFWGKFIVGRHYIGPLVFPFLMVALFARTKTVYCIVFAILLTSMLAGGIPPVNLLYQLPIIDLIKYGVMFNLYLNLLIIILAAVGYGLFFNQPFSSRKTCVILSGILMIIGCVLLALILPRTPISDVGILMSSTVSFILISLVYRYNIGSLNKLAHIIIIMAIATGVIYHHNISRVHPFLKGVHYKNSEFSKLMNRTDHSLKFSMERPDSLLISTQNIPSRGPSSLSNEYFSFIGLEENTYRAPVGAKGTASFPILKSHFISRSLPGSDLLLRKKFFFFDKVFLSKKSEYHSDFMEKPALLGALLENNIGVVDFPGDALHPVYSGQFDPEKNNLSKSASSAKILNLDVKEFNANGIKIVLETDKPGLLLYTDTWDEGWHAKVNGSSVPVLKVFNSYKGIELNEGKTEVEFYFSNSVLNALIVFNVAYFVFFVFTIVSFALKRETDTP